MIEWLRTLFEFPWHGVAGFLAVVGGVIVFLPKLPRRLEAARHYMQSSIQSWIGVDVAMLRIEGQVERRHEETGKHLEGVETAMHEGFQKINGRIEDAVRAGDATRALLEEHLLERSKE